MSRQFRRYLERQQAKRERHEAWKQRMVKGRFDMRERKREREAREKARAA